MKTWMTTLALGGMLALGTVGCDDQLTNPNGIDLEALRAEAALVAADGMFQDLSLAQDPGLESMGFQGVGALLASSGGPGQGQGGICQRKGQGGAFTCGNMARDGFTFTREVTFFDAGGAEQLEGFDPETTDEMHLVVTGEGTREHSFWTATLLRSRDMRITGLLSNSHILNGTGHSEVHRSGNPQDGVARTFDMVVDVTWDDVEHLQPKAEHPYPESGTVTRIISVVVMKDGVQVGGRNVTTIVTFTGEQFVTMTVDGEEYQIDLAQKGIRQRLGRGGGNQGG